MAAFKASALDFFNGIVPSAGGVFYTVDSRREAVDHVFRGVNGRFNASYLAHFHRLDPFHPRRFEEQRLPLVTVDHVGGLPAYRHSEYCIGFMAPLGLLHEVELHLRDAGRIVGGVALLRSPTEPKFGSGELSLLRRTHGFVERAFAACRLAAGRQPDEEPLTAYGLTAREVEVVRLVCEGSTNEEIGRALYIGLPTVKTHLQHVFRKLGVRSRTELVANLASQPFG